jgi:hypothetical protein
VVEFSMGDLENPPTGSPNRLNLVGKTSGTTVAESPLMSASRALVLLILVAGCADDVRAPVCAKPNTQTFDMRTLGRPATFVVHHPSTWSAQASTNAVTLTSGVATASVLVGPVSERGSVAHAQAYLDSIAAGASTATIERFSLRGRQAMRLETETPLPVRQGTSSTAVALNHRYYFVDGTTVDEISGSADASSAPEVLCEIDAIALSIAW